VQHLLSNVVNWPSISRAMQTTTLHEPTVPQAQARTTRASLTAQTIAYRFTHPSVAKGQL